MSSIGRIFRVTTFGESHATAVGCIIENVPPLLKINISDIQNQLDRRKPNQNSLLSARNEPDYVEILSGVQEGVTLGTPICLMVKNIDMKPSDYKKFSNTPRPGHADFTYLTKYGVKSNSGGGRSSARETVARVAAGGLAEIYLKSKFNVEIVSWVNSVGDIEIPKINQNDYINDENFNKKRVDQLGSFKIFKNNKLNGKEFIFQNEFLNKYFYVYAGAGDEDENLEKIKELDLIQIIKQDEIILFNNVNFTYLELINVRCPHPETAARIIIRIMTIKLENDSIGGTVACVIRSCPRSLGEPCFDKFEAELAKAMLSIPATKGFEIGSGFEGTKMKGSQHNDVFIPNNVKDSEDFLDSTSISKINLKNKTNNSGGTLGGITTGEIVFFKVAIKPVSTISQIQITSDWNGNESSLSATGRHDPCVLPRVMPIVEAMTAIVLMDFCLIQLSRVNSIINPDDYIEDTI